MTAQPKLTDTQTAILKAAAGRADGNIGLSLLLFVENPLPDDWNMQRVVIGGLAG